MDRENDIKTQAATVSDESAAGVPVGKPLGIVRYPHGKFRGGIRPADILPPLTNSDFQNNNFVIIEYDL